MPVIRTRPGRQSPAYHCLIRARAPLSRWIRRLDHIFSQIPQSRQDLEYHGRRHGLFGLQLSNQGKTAVFTDNTHHARIKKPQETFAEPNVGKPGENLFPVSCIHLNSPVKQGVAGNDGGSKTPPRHTIDRKSWLLAVSSG